MEKILRNEVNENKINSIGAHSPLSTGRYESSFIIAILSKQAIMQTITQKWQITCAQNSDSVTGEREHSHTHTHTKCTRSKHLDFRESLCTSFAFCGDCATAHDNRYNTVQQRCFETCDLPIGGQCKGRIFWIWSFPIRNMLSINLNNFSLWHDARIAHRAHTTHTMKTVLGNGHGRCMDSIVFENQWRACTRACAICPSRRFILHESDQRLQVATILCDHWSLLTYVYTISIPCTCTCRANGVHTIYIIFFVTFVVCLAWPGTDSEQHSWRVRTTCSPT